MLAIGQLTAHDNDKYRYLYPSAAAYAEQLVGKLDDINGIAATPTT